MNRAPTEFYVEIAADTEAAREKQDGTRRAVPLRIDDDAEEFLLADTHFVGCRLA